MLTRILVEKTQRKGETSRYPADRAVSAGAANIGQIIIKANRRLEKDNISRICKDKYRSKDRNKDTDKAAHAANIGQIIIKAK